MRIFITDETVLAMMELVGRFEQLINTQKKHFLDEPSEEDKKIIKAIEQINDEIEESIGF